MKNRQRTFYTDKQKSEMWDRWQRGELLSSIGRSCRSQPLHKRLLPFRLSTRLPKKKHAKS